MARQTWSLEDIPWDRFDPAKVDAELVDVAKAASLVERNAGDYVRYLCNVFDDDPEFRAVICKWGEEEMRHGEALGRWARLADPAFDFRASLERFRAAYRLPLDATASVRGSREGEMVARCVVEIGTSALYSALRDATEEPVLKCICAHIARDEFRHFGLFRSHLRNVGGRGRLDVLRRSLVACRRLAEVDDDELAVAYHAANTPDRPYDRVGSGRAFARRVCRHWRRDHIDRAVMMGLRSVGLPTQGRLAAALSHVAWWHLRRRRRALGVSDTDGAGAGAAAGAAYST